MSALLELDQTDIGARLQADEYFSDVRVLVQRKGVTENDVETALSVLNEQGGKTGACAIVLMPSLVPESGSAPVPLYRVRIGVQVIEQPLFSQAEGTGVGKSAEQIAERVRQVLHLFYTGRDGSTHYFTFDGMEPVEVEEGKVSYTCFFVRKGGDDQLLRATLPTLAKAAAEPSGFTITITGAGGESLYYSTDGGYPGTLYTAPFVVAAGVTVRATARRSGYLESVPREITA